MVVRVWWQPGFVTCSGVPQAGTCALLMLRGQHLPPIQDTGGPAWDKFLWGAALASPAGCAGWGGAHRGRKEGMGGAQVSHGAIQFMVYEELKKLAAGPLWQGPPALGAQQQQPLSSLEISTIGAASKLVASVATYPSQVRLRLR